MPKRQKNAADPAPATAPSHVVNDLKQVGYGAAILYGVIGFLLLGAHPAAIKAPPLLNASPLTYLPNPCSTPTGLPLSMFQRTTASQWPDASV